MLLSSLKVLKSHGWQYIPKLNESELTARFRGRPVLSVDNSEEDVNNLVRLCPTGAISSAPFSLDLGKCVFCGECSYQYPNAVKFTNDFRTSSATRDGLIVKAGQDMVEFHPEAVRKEVISYFGRALKLRQVCAGGENSCEMELNASMNVNFDFSRYGIEFVASPRHSDGVVITGPITEAMSAPLQLCWEAIPSPKVLILVGSDAVSGGVFADSPAINREFLDNNHVDLWIPGNPTHPLTFIEGVMCMLGRWKREKR